MATLLSRATRNVVAAMMTFAAAGAQGEPSADGPLSGTTLSEYGNAWLDARYRYEWVDQDGLADDARASTVRTRLGFETHRLHDISALIELENVLEVGPDSFNNTINGKTRRPVVADVEGTELNRAQLRYTGIPFTTATVGRQTLVFDNQRFIGDVDWRQNNQTFDAVHIANTSLAETTLRYAYIDRVNRIFGNRSQAGNYDADSHVFHASHVGLPIGTLTAYGYLLDFEKDAPTLSSQTYGISLVGTQQLDDDWRIGYRAEYARQQDYGSNPVRYRANYYHVAPMLQYGSVALTAGYEVLGSDGNTIGFSTPLATLHRFNGWADQFLTTPATGLREKYLDAMLLMKNMGESVEWFNGTHLHARLHDFSSDSGDIDYGYEWGVMLSKRLSEHYGLEFKYADYRAERFATDTQKLIFGVLVHY